MICISFSIKDKAGKDVNNHCSNHFFSLQTGIMSHVLITYQPSVKSLQECICLRFLSRPCDKGTRSVWKKLRANNFLCR